MNARKLSVWDIEPMVERAKELKEIIYKRYGFENEIPKRLERAIYLLDADAVELKQITKLLERDYLCK